ncbi:hypothetical protein [Calothrix sp. UHCC 0171]|uniref:hypothetical protein n=1 Tax=Calothrix sp. UHCC 0171 TaxID=3110245 RepID=UPI002B1FBFAC|nr:hypothetical protein [Calothrix sp. UHCC 0171]MEA5572169.1 hypothetical protein [Calothrix sp. UHCC 0171]
MQEKLNRHLGNSLQQLKKDNQVFLTQMKINASLQAANDNSHDKDNDLYWELLQNKKQITAQILTSISTQLDLDKLNDDLGDIAVEYFRLALIFEPEEQDFQKIIKILQLAEIDTSLNHIISLIDVFLASECK